MTSLYDQGVFNISTSAYLDTRNVSITFYVDRFKRLPQLSRKYQVVDVGFCCFLLAAINRSKTLFNIVGNSNSDKEKENSGTIKYIISPSTGNIILASNLLYLAAIRGNSSKHKWFCFLRFKINSSLVWKLSQNLHRNPWLSAFYSTCNLICWLLVIGFVQ